MSSLESIYELEEHTPDWEGELNSLYFLKDINSLLKWLVIGDGRTFATRYIPDSEYIKNDKRNVENYLWFKFMGEISRDRFTKDHIGIVYTEWNGVIYEVKGYNKPTVLSLNEQ